MQSFINIAKSFLKAFQISTDATVNNENNKSKADILECPLCHAQKVMIYWTDNALNANEKRKRGMKTGQCIIVESGVEKKKCQSCGHVWDERSIEETAFIMPKRRKELEK